jgi:hypothetical protein
MDLQFNLPEPTGAQLNAEWTLWRTYYYGRHVVESATGIEIRDHDEHPVGPKIPEKDWCLGAMEGALIVALKDDAITDMRFIATYTAVYRLADFVKARGPLRVIGCVADSIWEEL